jgi:hypothetical protein
VKRKNRWYDKYPHLAELLEELRFARPNKRDAHISGVMGIIKLDAPNLLERYVLDFPLDIKRRRWYDRDPYLWLLYNGLKYANKKLLITITKYLQASIDARTPRNDPACADTKERSILKGKKKKKTRNRKIAI